MRQQIYQWMRRWVDNPDDAEDLCQEVCLRCLLGLAKFRGKASFATWLYAIALNAYKDFLRKKGRNAESLESELGEGVLQAAQEAQAASEERQALVEQVRAALAQLVPRQRQLLEWKYGEGCSHEEIARRLGIQKESAWKGLLRAREAFKKAYEALGKEGL